MNEPLLDRIRLLERAVRRWRLVSLALLLISISLLAIAGTFGVVLLFEESYRRQVLMLRMDEQAAREEAEQALRAAEAAKERAQKENEAKGQDEINP